jgi:uncharacterized protein YceK
MKLINLFILFCVLLVLSSCETIDKVDSVKALHYNTSENREVLTYLKEVEWPKAYREQDTVLLDRILGEDFQMIDDSGMTYNKNDELDWIKNNTPSYDSFYFEIKRFEIKDNGTAVICGTGHILKDSVESIYQSSNVLVKRGENWKAILSHVSGYKNLKEE